MESGTRLGHYEILDPLGAGGMGEVYLAQDTRLGRKVAIKVLPAEFAGDPERLARFEQEARAAAALNHPHIAVVHDFGAEGEIRFMVQELLEGTTLREPLNKGALPLKRTLALAAEIAEGLAAAHDEGITHRDLKPENLFVTTVGHIKILDFGLAKLTEGTLLSSGAASMSPTRLGTAAGQIMGTAGYMAPEQVEAAPDIDFRADVFAFGCLLYEMATGRHPFAGKNAVQTLDRIVNEEPPAVETIAPDLPERLRWILRKCLAKDRAERYQAASDLVIDLRSLAAEVEAGTARPLSGSMVPATSVRTVPLSWAIATGLALVAITALLSWQRASPRATAAADVVRFSLRLPDGMYLWGGFPDEARMGGYRPSQNAIAISPDGRTIVYAATDGENAQLYSRQLDEPSEVPIAGTEGGSRPFFSADGEMIGFTAGFAIRTVPRVGGTSRLLFAEPLARGGFQWTDAGDVVFLGPRAAVWRFPTRGGIAETLAMPDPDAGESGFRTPWRLPGDDAILFTVMRRRRDWANAQLVVRRREAAASEVLFTGASSARYLATEHLVFARDGDLWAVGFDSQGLRPRGEPVRVLEDVMHAIGAANDSIDSGVAQYDVSDSGTLAYVTGGTYGSPPIPVVWVGEDGEPEPIRIAPDFYSYPRLSPDDRYLALRAGPESEGDIIVFENATGATRRLRLDGNQSVPVWSADATRIVFSSDHEAPNLGIFAIDASLTGTPRRFTSSETIQAPNSWSTDGTLLFVQDGDIWAVDTESEAEPRPFVEGEGRQSWSAFSPDGNWFAYGSNHSGEYQVYVRPFPAGEPVYPVTTDGGTRPLWSHDGRRIFYRAGLNNRSRMMAVDRVANDPPRWGQPRELFDRPYLGTSRSLSYDVSREGRFLMLENFSHTERKVTEIHVVLNWFEELRRLVPAR